MYTCTKTQIKSHLFCANLFSRRQEYTKCSTAQIARSLRWCLYEEKALLLRLSQEGLSPTAKKENGYRMIAIFIFEESKIKKNIFLLFNINDTLVYTSYYFRLLPVSYLIHWSVSFICIFSFGLWFLSQNNYLKIKSYLS